MSAPVRYTVQQLADRTGVSRRLLFHAAAVHRYGCAELVKAASAGLLTLSRCETLAKALPHGEQREFLAELPSMSSLQRCELLAIIKGDWKHRQNVACESSKGALNG